MSGAGDLHRTAEKHIVENNYATENKILDHDHWAGCDAVYYRHLCVCG